MIIVSLLTCSLWLFSPKVGLMGQRVGFTVCCDLPGSAAPFCKKSVLRELMCRPRFAQTEHSEEHVIMLKHLHDTLGKREGLVASRSASFCLRLDYGSMTYWHVTFGGFVSLSPS